MSRIALNSITKPLIRKLSCKGLGSKYLGLKSYVVIGRTVTLLLKCKASGDSSHSTLSAERLDTWVAVHWPLMSIMVVLPWHRCSVESNQDALPPQPVVPAKMDRPEEA